MKRKPNVSGVSKNLSDSITKDKLSKAKGKGPLHGMSIAISVSESEELGQLGLSEQHLKDISIEIARYLIVNGATMLYGGDLRRGGFTELFSELSYQYKHLSDKAMRFINYIPFPTSRDISTRDEVKFVKNQVEVKRIVIPKRLGKIDTKKKYEPLNNLFDRYIISECLADMRKIMAADSDARIILGGRQKGYLGYYPGIVEEAFYSLKKGKAVYLLGGFGGATKSIIDTIMRRQAIQLTNDFQFDTKFLRDFRKYLSKEKSVKLDYNIICDFFKQHSLKSLSEQNGLTTKENQILFNSNNIHEIVFLIIKGLQKISTTK